MRKEKKLLAKLTGAVVNQCCSCKKEFICTGRCFLIRDGSQMPRRIGLCFCKKCLLAPEIGIKKLSAKYVKGRKNCYID